MAVGDGIVGVTCSETTLGGCSWFGMGGRAASLLGFAVDAGSDTGCGPGSGSEFGTGGGPGSDIGSSADFGIDVGFGSDFCTASGSDSGADVGSASDFVADLASGVNSGTELTTGDLGAVGGFVAKGLGLCPPVPPVGGAATETGGCDGPNEAVIIIGVPPPNTCVSGPKGPEKELFLP